MGDDSRFAIPVFDENNDVFWKGKKSREMYNEIDLDIIDINSEPPTEEPFRQYYFMAKCREWVLEFEQKNGRRPLAFTQTFGCPKV